MSRRSFVDAHRDHLDPDRYALDAEDVAQMRWQDRKEREGWTRCPDCGDMMHRDDYAGATCSCDEEVKPPLTASSPIWIFGKP